MKHSKKLFLIFAILFFCIMAYVVYDISSRTTFPGAKTRESEQVRDTMEVDTVSIHANE